MKKLFVVQICQTDFKNIDMIKVNSTKAIKG